MQQTRKEPRVENYTPHRGINVEYFDRQPELPQGVIPVQPYNMKNLAPTRKINIGGHIVDQTLINTTEIMPYYNDAVSIDPPDPFAVSLNQSLAGKDAHPATKIKPVVVPPITDLSYWRDNNLINYSQINVAGPQQDMYLSGYAESTCCGYLNENSQLIPEQNKERIVMLGGKVRENYCGPQNPIVPQTQPYKLNNCSSAGGQIVSPVPMEDRPYLPGIPVQNPGVNAPRYAVPIRGRENYAPQGPCNNPTPVRTRAGYRCGGAPGMIVSPKRVEDRPFIPEIPVQDQPSMPVIGTPFVENFDYTTIDNPEQVFVQPNQSGWVNTSCGYNAEQVFESGLPSNLPAGNCEQSPELKRYNENMFTSIVTPGVYTRTQVNEPINANIGISFQQQFEPVSCKRDDLGLTYTQHDPRIIEPVEESEVPVGAVIEKANYDNVYDPRFYGYGTSYRSYNEPMVNQPRFYYDDVNAIRMPSYITRSKIDHLPFADTYESPPEGSQNGNVHNPHIRALAQDAWFRDSMTFRNDLTERLMRKVNAESWQKRMYPNSARPVGTNKH